MSFSGPITISEGLRYRLDSYGNGAAYSLQDIAGGVSVWLQGDDAATFRDLFDKIEETRPDYVPDQILEHLWDAHDYGVLAS